MRRVEQDKEESIVLEELQKSDKFSGLVSPDEKYVVWFNPGSAGSGPVELVELLSEKVVARWLGHRPAWSPDGKSIVFGCQDGRHDGMWVYDLKGQ